MEGPLPINENALLPLLQDANVLSAVVAALGILVSVFLVWYQLRQSYYWNRKKTTQELCDKFLEASIYSHWENIERSVIEEGKSYDDLTESEKNSVRRLLGYFESFSVLLRNDILEPEFLYDRFSGIVPVLYECSLEFILKYRELRNDPGLFEGFVQLCRIYGGVDARLKPKRVETFAKAAKRVKSRGRLKSPAQIIRELAESPGIPDHSVTEPYDVLLVVDIQNDFFPGGVLSVPEANSLLEPLNDAMAAAQQRGMVTALIRDWHPAHHATHFTEFPPHCVAGTPGAEFHPQLELPDNRVIIDFGTNVNWPGFNPFENPALGRLLASERVQTVYVSGIALEFCIQTTCLGAAALGKRVVAVEPLIRGTGNRQRAGEVWDNLQAKGVVRMRELPMELAGTGVRPPEPVSA